MSGHSKWSTIKRQKGVTDARRGAAFTKAANAITIAAREGGGNPEMNFKLRLTIDAARAINMPKDNIDRAVARGTGASKDGASLEQVTYEGYGPAGVAIMVEAVTDNRSRTAQEVRSAFERSGGRLSGPGSVAHSFRPVGQIVVKSPDADTVLTAAAEAGAEDIESDTEETIVYCEPNKLESVKQALEGGGLEVINSELSKKPTTNVNIADEGQANSILSLVSKLEDLDDVQKVYANFDIDTHVMEKVAS